MKKTVTINETKYEIATLSFGQGKEVFSPANPAADTTALIRHSLNNADGGARTVADIDALPYPDAMKLITECLDVSGLRKEKSQTVQGEDQPAEQPA